MSASIAGTTFFSSKTPARRPPPGVQASQNRTNSAPSLQTAASSTSSAPPNAPSPMAQNAFYNHPYPQMAHHLAASTVVQPLQPLTPISSPQTSSPQLYSNQSVISFASTSSASSSIHNGKDTGVSRASSCRSTNSVQAVPMKKPQRGPAVPRIVTRGLSAIGAYGLGSPTTTSAPVPLLPGSPPPPPPLQRPNASTSQRNSRDTSPHPSPRILPPNSPRPLEDTGPLPPPPPLFRQSHSYGSACSPVEETSANSSNGSDNEGGRIRRGRRALSSGTWTVRNRDSTERERVESTNSSNGRSSLASPARTSTSSNGPNGGLTASNLGNGEGGRPRETSTTSNVTVTSGNGSVGSGSNGGNMMIPNSMGVVGSKRTVEDFQFGEVLGEGSYSTVRLHLSLKLT